MRDEAAEDRRELPQELVPHRPPGLVADRLHVRRSAALELPPPRDEDSAGGRKGVDEDAHLGGPQVARQPDLAARDLRQGDPRHEGASACDVVPVRPAPPRLHVGGLRVD